jgi:hypothetical protein
MTEERVTVLEIALRQAAMELYEAANIINGNAAARCNNFLSGFHQSTQSQWCFPPPPFFAISASNSGCC